MRNKIEYKVFENHFGSEKFLFTISSAQNLPKRHDFIFYKETIYKVLYLIYNYDDNECDIYVCEAIRDDLE
jgi:hypothetical protein